MNSSSNSTGESWLPTGGWLIYWVYILGWFGMVFILVPLVRLGIHCRILPSSLLYYFFEPNPRDAEDNEQKAMLRTGVAYGLFWPLTICYFAGIFIFWLTWKLGVLVVLAAVKLQDLVIWCCKKKKSGVLSPFISDSFKQ